MGRIFSTNRIIWSSNVRRMNTLNKAVLCVSILLLLTSDLYNYVNGIWIDFPSQYAVFINHILSVPILGGLIWLNTTILKNGKAPFFGLKTTMVLNIAAFLPFMLIYYYWDLVDYNSSGIMLLYISAFGFLFRFPGRARVAMTVYFTVLYFAMLFYVGIPYESNPSLYLNGVVILTIYYAFSNFLFLSEHTMIQTKLDIEQKNISLSRLNDNLKKSKRRIKKQNKQLKERNNSLKGFAEIIVHDIKGPLKMINNFSGILSNKYQEQMEEEDRPLLGYMSDGSESLIGIVDGLYEFTLLSFDKTLNLEIIDLNFTIKRALTMMTKQFDDNKVQVIFNQDFPKVLGVEELLQDVFLNLFGNAVKFKRENVETYIKISNTIYDNNFVEVCVSDNGIGIPEKSQLEIFELFRKLHRSEEYEGFGIGLASSKKIIQKHGGEIWLKSKVGEGTSVYFTVPKAGSKIKREAHSLKTLKSKQ